MNVKVRQLKHLTAIKASNVDKKSVEGHVPISLCNYTDVYHNDLITKDMPFMQATATRSQIDAFTLRRGDVLITKDSESADDIGIPAYVSEDVDGLVSGYHLSLLRSNPDVMEPKFMFWALKAQPAQHHFTVSAKGITRFALGYDELGRTPIPLPTLEEQRAIVRFLDEETAKIDALIDKKRCLNGLLAERWQRIVAGVIEQAQADCRMMPLKRLTTEPLKYGLSEVATERQPDLPRFVRITDIKDDGRLREDSHVTVSEEIAQPYLLRQGDVLLARSGATVGKSFLYDESWGRACFAGYLVRARLDTRLVRPRWVHLFTQSATYWAWIQRTKIQATIPNVSAERYSILPVPVPAVDAQDRLLQECDSEEMRMRQVSAKNSEIVRHLEEYRSALITAAVTGQIDVRGAA